MLHTLFELIKNTLKVFFKYKNRRKMLYSFFIHFIKHYAWEPTAALVTKSYLCRLPALERFYRETKNFATKVDPHNLESQNQVHSRRSPENSPFKM